MCCVRLFHKQAHTIQQEAIIFESLFGSVPYSYLADMLMCQ
jgi:hypothetical protein